MLIKIHFQTIFELPQGFYMLQVGLNIKEIRSRKGILQKEVAAAAGLHPANYNKIEKGEREPSVDALAKVAKLFDMTIDQVVYYEGDIPSEVTIEDKSVLERMKMIDQLGDDDKQAVFRVVDSMLTKNKFKDFFQEQLSQ